MAIITYRNIRNRSKSWTSWWKKKEHKGSICRTFWRTRRSVEWRWKVIGTKAIRWSG